MFAIGFVLLIVFGIIEELFDTDSWFVGGPVLIGFVLMFVSIVKFTWIWLP